ncbi:hypothetical protein BDY24DRAFT_399503 [Mrakia frigida]|uniref:uncharacterized protein n=1 Tax=Mrakia frigida TaxID=29902 RepID=UPI003FCBF60F
MLGKPKDERERDQQRDLETKKQRGDGRERAQLSSPRNGSILPPARRAVAKMKGTWVTRV